MTDEELNLLIERRAQEMVRERDAEKRRLEEAKDAARHDYYDSIEKTVASGRGYIRFLVPHTANYYAYLNTYTFTEDLKCSAEFNSHGRGGNRSVPLSGKLEEWLQRESCFGKRDRPGFPRESVFDNMKQICPTWNPDTDRFFMPLTFDPFAGRLFDKLKFEGGEWFSKIARLAQRREGFCFASLKEEWVKRGHMTWYRLGLWRWDDVRLNSLRAAAIQNLNGGRGISPWLLKSAEEMWGRPTQRVLMKDFAKKSILRRIRRHRSSVSKSAISFFKMFAGAKAISEALKQQTNATNTQQTNRGVRKAHHRGAFSVA